MVQLIFKLLRLFIILIVFSLNILKVYAIDFKKLEHNQKHPEIWYLTTDIIPKVSMNISFPIGYAFDPDDKLGLAKMVASTMDEGAGEYDSDAFRKILVDNQIDLSYSVSANRFSLHLDFFKFDLNKALEISKLSLGKPRFDNDTIELMREQLLASIEHGRKQPDVIAYNLLRKDYYQNHVFAKPSSGTLTTLKKITQADLRGFHQKLTQDKVFVSAVGDMSSEEIIYFVTNLLGDLPKNSTINTTIPEYSVQPKSQKFNIFLDVPQSTVVMATPSIKRTDKDFMATYIAVHILGGGGFGSQLVNNLREEKGLTYSVSAALDSSFYDGRMLIQFATDNKTVDDALLETEKTLRDLAKNGITQKQLDQAKINLKGQYIINFETNHDISELAQSLYNYGLPFDYTKKRDALFDAVTLEQVNSILKKLLLQPLTMIIVGGNKNINNFKSVSLKDIKF